MSGYPKLTCVQLFLTFLRLGLTSFGGPVAHIAFFRDEFVKRKRCLKEETYADLVALCQFLPGPASSQVGIGIGLSQSGLKGGLAAWSGFTLPSALAMILFAHVVTNLKASVVEIGWLHGLKVVAVAVVAQAIWGMTKTLCPDKLRGSIAIFSAVLTLAWPGFPGQISAIACGAILGSLFVNSPPPITNWGSHTVPSKLLAVISLSLFLALLLILPLLAAGGSQVLVLVDSFYRSGAMVFGGGHVVLPLLQAEFVNPGWISKDFFLAGYGAAQAVPGPLFTFSAYLGAAMTGAPNVWLGGLICLIAIYLPSFLLVYGILPFWETLRTNLRIRKVLAGINAAVVGLLISAFYDPVWRSGILSAGDFLLALAAFGLLALWNIPPWLVVGLTGLGGAFISSF